MAWVSFVLVVVLFYTPLFGLGRTIQEQDVPLNVGPLSLDIPYTGYIRLFLYGVLAWLTLWVLLVLIERLVAVLVERSDGHERDEKYDLLAKARLRNGMLYAIRPFLSNRIALVLAWVVLMHVVAYLALQFILGHVDLGLGDVLPYGPGLEDLLPYGPDWKMVALGVFTLIAHGASKVEQRRRYEADAQHNQQQRRQRWEEQRVVGALSKPE